MARRKITFTIISCLVLALITSESLSQARRTRRSRSGRTTTGSARTTAQWQATDPTQPPPPQPPEEMLNQMQARQREFQQQMRQMRAQARRSNIQMLKQTLNATDAQWQQLEPQLLRIERLKHEATVSLDLSCFGPANFTGGGMMGGFSGRGGPAGMGGGMMGGGQDGAPGRKGGFGADGGPGGRGGGMMGGSAGAGTRPRGMGGKMMGGMAGPAGLQSFTFMNTFQSGRPPSYKNPDELTDGDVLCEELLDLLQNPAAPAPEITRRVQALRTLRQQATKDLAVAKTQLRPNVNPKQEATLILMGYLD